MKATFDNTIKILVNAYLNDTLKHQDCTACAVGNIIKHNNAAVFTGIGAQDTMWLRLIGIRFRSDNERYMYVDIETAERQVEASGYSLKELHRIEKAFENCDPGETTDDWMLNGLMDVVDVLADIHGVDLEVKESAKLLFVKA